MKRLETHPAKLTQRRFRVAGLIGVLLLAFAIRGLTANFLAAHFNDPGWFQSGSFAVFDKQAQEALDGKESFFWIPDSSRTDLMQYPPGGRVWIAAIYAVTGERSAASVQRVQWLLDAFAVLLVVGIGVAAFDWAVGLTAGVMAALSTPLALSAVTPGADALTNWFVLGAIWLLVLCFKRDLLIYAILAGAVLGIACWVRVNPLFLFVAWAAVLVVFGRGSWRHRITLGSAVVLSTLLVISPVIIRNLVVFYPQVAPTGLNIGWNFWAGIGETERGAEFGAPCCDEKMIEEDRREMGLPPDAPLGLVFPDGIRRDKERGRKAFAVIKAHPIWYVGVMVRRLWGHLKLAGKPVPNVGSAGINVTSSKCLTVELQKTPLSFGVNVLGMLQSVFRYLTLPGTLIGIWVSFRRDFRTTSVLLSTVVYYLATLSVGHSEIRYGLTMQALFLVFCAVAFGFTATLFRSLCRRSGV